MTKLSKLQTALIEGATMRPDGSLLPVPVGNAATAAALSRALDRPMRKGLATRLAASDEASAATAAHVLTEAGRVAAFATEAGGPTETADKPVCDRASPGGKLGTVLNAIGRKRGATLAELTRATGWQPHSTRAPLTRMRQRGFPAVLTHEGGARPTNRSAEPMPRRKRTHKAGGVDLAAIAGTDAATLRWLWEAQRGCPPLPTLSARLMRLALAWDVQAAEKGGETIAIRRQWQAIIRRRSEGLDAAAAMDGLAAPAAAKGTRLLKSWGGEMQEVTVQDEGVLWNGRTHSSLSAVARAMTGTHATARSSSACGTGRHDPATPCHTHPEVDGGGARSELQLA